MFLGRSWTSPGQLQPGWDSSAISNSRRVDGQVRRPGSAKTSAIAATEDLSRTVAYSVNATDAKSADAMTRSSPGSYHMAAVRR